MVVGSYERFVVLYNVFMNKNLWKANKIALELTDSYQNIKYGDLVVPVPYFINIAEQEYKKAMLDIGLTKEEIKKITEYVKAGKTALGAYGGKGSPEELDEDVSRLVEELKEMRFVPKTEDHLRDWMKQMHIGLDCSGYVYNVFKKIEEMLDIEILSEFVWAEPETKKPTHAGVFIFDSDNLETINDFNLKSLDILIFDDYSHVGIVLEVESDLKLVDCSMGNDGIFFHDLDTSGENISVSGSTEWERYMKDKRVKVKRIDLETVS